jgi:hypothetical protein
MESKMEARLNRTEASAYLWDRHRLKCARVSLARLASIGGGPRFQRVGPFVFYTPAELDRWAEAKTTPLLTKTSDIPPTGLISTINHPPKRRGRRRKAVPAQTELELEL